MDLALSLLGGLAVLVLGAELLVRGAVRLAERAGVSPLLIGLTIVSFGTTTPELVTSVSAALAGSPGIAVGNIVGSNLINMMLILGLAALVRPLPVPVAAIRRDGVLVIAASGALVLTGLVWTLDRPVGALFLTALAAYLVHAARQERREAMQTLAHDRAAALATADADLEPQPPAPDGPMAWLIPIGLALLGLALLFTGARFFVDAATDLAQRLGISEAVIGLTVVAAGTSMPELATSVVAALRRRPEVAVGNILGAGIYNILGIGGLTGLVAPTVIPPAIARFDAPLMMAVAVLLLAMLRAGRRLGRAGGAALLLGYVAYLWAIWPA